ncbi:MAG TPA: M14 family zinc carboxypeptidase [Solirubrobacterales bacterium]
MRRIHAGALGAAVAATLTIGCALPAQAVAGGIPMDRYAAPNGIVLAGSPYRWTALAPRDAGVTIVERIKRSGGHIGRWWTLRGSWYLTAPAWHGGGTGVSGDESVVVLTRIEHWQVRLRHRTQMAVLEAARRGAANPVHRFSLSGDYSAYAISPDGSTLFLAHWLSQPEGFTRFALRAYDLRRDRLLPAGAIAGDGEILSGVPVARWQDAAGHHVYTRYRDRSGRGYVLALDTVGRRLRLVEPQGEPPPAATIGAFSHVLAHSVGGRPIELKHVGNFGLPGKLLVFGCIHGDECGAGALEPLENGCPDPHVNAFLVPDLDPDGSAAGSRLNARGVDLNRNFGSQWRPVGALGSLEYGGPRPFSEPETRLAARLVRQIQPRVTIWFHQDRGGHAYVRAWGQSAPAGRRFARLAGIPFRLLRWPAGTGPNWQNHRFPGTASFVVETPRGKLSSSLRSRLTAAISGLGEEVGDDPAVPRKG